MMSKHSNRCLLGRLATLVLAAAVAMPIVAGGTAWADGAGGSGTSLGVELIKEPGEGENTGTQLGMLLGGAVVFTVEFDSQGGSPVGAQSVPYARTAKKPADPVREGWAFVGWSTDSGDYVQGTTVLYDFALQVTSNLKLYAMWVESGESVEITLHANGGMFGEGDEAAETRKIVQKTGDVYVLPKVGDSDAPKRAGYKLAGWRTANGADGNWGDPIKADSKVTQEITLYACWDVVLKATLPDSLTFGIEQYAAGQIGVQAPSPDAFALTNYTPAEVAVSSIGAKAEGGQDGIPKLFYTTGEGDEGVFDPAKLDGDILLTLDFGNDADKRVTLKLADEATGELCDETVEPGSPIVLDRWKAVDAGVADSVEKPGRLPITFGLSLPSGIKVHDEATGKIAQVTFVVSVASKVPMDW